jgi:PTS system nitrogen regulatory IIA component
MANELMTLEQVAGYLQRDAREISKMAVRGKIPGRKVGGQWRFARAEINQWIETQMHSYTEEELTVLEGPKPDGEHEPLVSALLSEATIAVPLRAATRTSVLKELVNLAEQTWQVYDPESILTAIKQREELASTALGSGVAIPHPRRPIPGALGEDVLAYGRTGSGIPFGAPDGGLTDIYFLVCCREEQTHLRVLARLSRLLLRSGFLDELREAETPAATWEVIAAAERALPAE